MDDNFSIVSTPLGQARTLRRYNKVLERLLCSGEGDRTVYVIACRYYTEVQTNRGTRTYPGAKQWRLGSAGTLLQLVDNSTFVVPETGEILIVTL